MPYLCVSQLHILTTEPHILGSEILIPQSPFLTSQQEISGP